MTDRSGGPFTAERPLVLPDGMAERVEEEWGVHSWIASWSGMQARWRAQVLSREITETMRSGDQ